MAITDNLKAAPSSNLPSTKASEGIRGKQAKEKRPTASRQADDQQANDDPFKLDYKKLLKQSVGYIKDVGEFVGEAIAGPPRPTQVAADISPERLEKTLRNILKKFPDRSFLNTAQLDGLAAHLGESFKASGGRVTEQVFKVDFSAMKALGMEMSEDDEAVLKAIDGNVYRNVIASFGPQDGERLIIGAHYDTAAAQINGQLKGLPGADDNTSGVVGLLELAHQLGKKPPAKRVDLVAFTLEEPPFFRTPFMGSAQHAKSLREAGVDAKMISLEMIGYFDKRPETQAYPPIPVVKDFMKWKYGPEGDYIAVVSKPGQALLARQVANAISKSPIESHYLVAPEALPGVDFSDHHPYWAEGYDAVQVTDTAFLRNPMYHQPGDLPDRLDYQSMAHVIHGVLNMAHSWARTPGASFDGESK